MQVGLESLVPAHLVAFSLQGERTVDHKDEMLSLTEGESVEALLDFHHIWRRSILQNEKEERNHLVIIIITTVSINA